jgi:hypothetical protein
MVIPICAVVGQGSVQRPAPRQMLTTTGAPGMSIPDAPARDPDLCRNNAESVPGDSRTTRASKEAIAWTKSVVYQHYPRCVGAIDCFAGIL